MYFKFKLFSNILFEVVESSPRSKPKNEGNVIELNLNINLNGLSGGNVATGNNSSKNLNIFDNSTKLCYSITMFIFCIFQDVN